MTQSTIRQRTYEVMDTNRTFYARLFNVVLMLLIFCNVVSVVLESVRPLYLQYQDYFHTFELFSIFIFSMEYLARIWIAPDNPTFTNSKYPRLAFIRSGMAIVDILAILPFYFGMFFSTDARILRGLRLIRIFKLTRYSTSMELMVTVIKKELPNIGSALFVMMILIIIAASGIYVVERDVQPEHFGSIPSALWWATVTLTTVGYGDVVPITTVGRGFGMVLMLTGVGMAALPAGILASGYSRELSIRREKYQAELYLAMEDGEISTDEMKHLKSVRKHLGISEEEAGALEIPIEVEKLQCPHCGKKVR